jgi:hypothetical protein|tara:strand:+ start:2040 stop:2741 length:702 start_codon:yes stop_codon:yes gene_type:complete
MTANKTMGALQGFSYLFNKNWPVETQINILGYDLPDFDLPDNCNYISLGKQRGKDYWSSDMIDFFTNCSDDLFYLTFEDAFIISPVDRNLLEYAYEFCQINRKNLLRFNLTSDLQTRNYDVIETYDEFELIESNQGEIFRLSLNHSIWNREQFLYKLEPNQTPNFFESPNKMNSKNDGLGVYGFKGNYPLYCSETYRRGKKVPNPYLEAIEKIKKLNDDDITIIEKNNWVPII